MVHEFIMLNKNDIPNSTSYALKGDNMVMVLDDYIVANNPLFFYGFKSYKVSFNNKGEGLDYHGNTIIPTDSILDFIKNLSKVKNSTLEPMLETSRVVSKEILKKQLEDLIYFCEKAKRENKYIIHFGL